MFLLPCTSPHPTHPHTLPLPHNTHTHTLTVVQGGRTDFSNVAITVNFPATLSSDSVTVAVGAGDDFINEANEGFLIVIRVEEIDSADGPHTFIRKGVALMRIVDDDGKLSVAV